jgi:hypothetical protein
MARGFYNMLTDGIFYNFLIISGKKINENGICIN